MASDPTVKPPNAAEVLRCGQCDQDLDASTPLNHCPKCGYSLSLSRHLHLVDCRKRFDRKLRWSLRGVAALLAAVLSWQLYAAARIVPKMVKEIGVIWSSEEDIAYGKGVGFIALDLPCSMYALAGLFAFLVFVRSVWRGDDRTPCEAAVILILVLLGLGPSLMVFSQLLD